MSSILVRSTNVRIGRIYECGQNPDTNPANADTNPANADTNPANADTNPAKTISGCDITALCRLRESVIWVQFPASRQKISRETHRACNSTAEYYFHTVAT